MFFSAAKIFWIVLNPLNLMLILLSLASMLLWTRWRRLGVWLASLLTVWLLGMAILPLGGLLLAPLQDRFPPFAEGAAGDEPVNGIILLAGGAVDGGVSRLVGHAVPGRAADRLVEFMRLARRYPKARLLISGGSAALTGAAGPWDREAPLIADYLVSRGIRRDRLLIEDRSRDTYENALFGQTLAHPKADEYWLLVTSSWHMPRAMAVFRALDWPVAAAPAGTPGRKGFRLGFNLDSGLGSLGTAMHEYLGLLAYRLNGRSNTLWPGP